MAQVQCEISIVRLANFVIDHLPHGNLFVRYYVYAGAGRRIKVDTREIPCASNPHWDETSTLECLNAGSDTMKEAIRSRNVVFELRLRRPYKSKLLGRAELGWPDDTLEERRVDFVMKKLVAEGVKVPTLFVRMGTRVRVSEQRGREKSGDREHREECGCGCCRWIGSEEDMFVAAAMVDACY